MSQELASSWFQKTAQSQLKNTPQATVPPRVMGYEIHKPKIRISRLDMSALNVQPPDQDNNVDTTNDGTDASNDDNDDNDDDEEDPIIIRTRRRRPENRPQPVSEGEDEAEASIIIRTRRPRPPPQPNPSNLDNISEEEGHVASADDNDDDEDEQDRNHETVLLFPRLVLERIRLTPSRASSSATSRRQSGESPTVISSSPETPRARESFDDFIGGLGGLDPMEGPSWLFSDDNATPAKSKKTKQRQTKSREEKRQENTLKARLSSASRKLSLEGEEPSAILPVETVADEPSSSSSSDIAPAEGRRGSRAAAKAARSALKEQPMNTKLRQGDPNSKSVYDDFVPGTKRKSDNKKLVKSTKKKKSNEK